MSDDFEKRITQLEVLTEEKWANHAGEAGRFREDTKSLIASGYNDIKKELNHQFELLTKVMDNRFEIMKITLDGITEISNKCADDIPPIQTKINNFELEHVLTRRWAGWLAATISLVVSILGLIARIWIK